jgi:site-specific DNA recombinase
MPQPEIRPDRVAIYIRWSTDDQGEGTTLEVQREACEAYIRSQGWQVTASLVFIDDGYSGGNMERPALSRLRRAAQDGLVDCVVLFKIDRLSRNVVDTVNLVLREWDGRCHVKSAREAIDTTTQQGKMFFYTLVSFAEWERSVIKERTYAGKLRRLQEGKNPGFRPPYGLQVGNAPGTFALVAAEAAVVKRIFDLYLQGMGYRQIALALHREGVSFREGRPWSAQTVMATLRNPIYVGRLVYGRTGAGPVESPHLPVVIDGHAWADAQARRARRAQQVLPGRAVAGEHLLTGLLRCLRCGSAMMGRKRYGPGDGAPYYVCTGQRNKGRAFCDAAYVRQDLLDRWVVERLVARYGALAALEACDGAVQEQVRRQMESAEAALSSAAREQQALERELAVIGRDYRRELLTAAEYREHRAAVEAEQARLGAREAALRETLAALNAPATELPDLTPKKAWALLEMADRKHLIRELLPRLAVYRAPGSARVTYDLVWTAPGPPQQHANRPGARS